eukprot:365565_1
MASGSKSTDDSDGQSKLLALHIDIFTYLLGFLRGKDMATLQCTTKQWTNAIMEDTAHRLLFQKHPHLSEDLLKQHMKYTNMINTTFKYMWHIANKEVPHVRDVGKRYRSMGPTKLSDPSHIHYLCEKAFCEGNIIFLIRLLDFLKQYEFFDENNVDDVKFCCKFFVRIGSLIDDMNIGSQMRRLLGNETKLYILRHGNLCVGQYREAILHLCMMDCCDGGFTELAVEFRKMGAVIKPKMHDASKWKSFFTEIEGVYWEDYFWLDVKDPGYDRYAEEDRNKVLIEKLHAKIKVLSIGEVYEHEKMNEMSIITANDGHSVKQMIMFAKQLLENNGISSPLKDKVQQWIIANDFN